MEARTPTVRVSYFWAMAMRYTRAAEPTDTNFISLVNLKNYLRIDTSDDDTVLAQLLTSARQACEEYTGRLLGSGTVTYYMDGFEDSSFIAGPVTAISSVTYYDIDNVLQTLSTSRWYADLVSSPQRIAFDAPPAVFLERYGQVIITTTAGHSTVPGPILQAMRMLSAHFYDNRQAVVTGTIATEMPLAVHALLSPYRVYA
jgi:uncharacterized phiE125 gp8 family phage protein